MFINQILTTLKQYKFNRIHFIKNIAAIFLKFIFKRTFYFQFALNYLLKKCSNICKMIDDYDYVLFMIIYSLDSKKIMFK